MVSIENFLSHECVERKIKGLAAKFTGPANRKSSGKSYGSKNKEQKTKKASDTKNSRKKTKNRVRDRKNIGKRRKPSEKSSAD